MVRTPIDEAERYVEHPIEERIDHMIDPHWNGGNHKFQEDYDGIHCMQVKVPKLYTDVRSKDWIDANEIEDRNQRCRVGNYGKKNPAQFHVSR